MTWYSIVLVCLLLYLQVYVSHQQVVGQFSECDPNANGPFGGAICDAGMRCTKYAVGNGSLSVNGTCTICGKGNYCPRGTPYSDGAYCSDPCPATYYCPDPLTKVFCPAGHYCPEGSSQPIRCNRPGYYCPANSSETSVCPDGYYCKTSKQQKICPKGSFCLEGSNSPRSCPLLSSCISEGLRLPEFSYVSVLILGIVMILFISILTWEYKQRKQDQFIANKMLKQQSDAEVAKQALHRLFNDCEYETQFTGFTTISKPVRIRFENISLQLPNGKVIIKNITGTFRAGSVNAVMGTSGCGKTSFLNALTGKAYYAETSGDVFINSNKMDPSVLKDVMAFVPQNDDTIHHDLSVRHNIEFSAKLRSKRDTDVMEILHSVNDTLRILQLEHCQHTIVGSVSKRGVSGGQKKRVNIAVELVTFPKILFLDEPTSGLDASSAIEIIRALRSLATLGVTIVMVIHQPRWSLFQLFDNILLLGKGGESVFNGSPKEAVEYFEEIGFEKEATDNPADWLMDCISGIIKNTKQHDHSHLPKLWEEKVKTMSSIERRHRGLSISKASKRKSSDSTKVTTKTTDKVSKKLSSVDEVKIEMTSAQLGLYNNNVGASSDDNKLTDESEDGEESEDDVYAEQKSFGGLLPKEIVAIRQQLASLVGKSVNEVLDADDLYRLFTKLNVNMTYESVEFLLAQLEKQFGGSIQVKELPNIVANKSNSLLSTLRNTRRETIPAQMIKQPSSYENVIAVLTREKQGFLKQLQLFTIRSLFKMRARVTDLALDLFLISLSASVVGILYGTSWTISKLPLLHMMNSLFVGTLNVVGTLPKFGDEKLQYYRESAAGINRLAYGLSNMITDMLMVLVRALLYSALSYSLTSPMQDFREFFTVCFLMAFWGSGLAYVLSISLDPSPAQIVGVLVPVFGGALLSGVEPTLSDLKSNIGSEILAGLSYARWSVEALVGEEVKHWPVNVDYEVETFVSAYGFDTTQYTFNCWILFIQGISFRILAILALFFLYTKKQK